MYVYAYTQGKRRMVDTTTCDAVVAVLVNEAVVV